MAPHARITVDLARIEANARTLATRLTGIAIVGVTKVTCGSPEVALALLAGGAQAIGESRLENAERLRSAGIAAPIWLLRSPPPAAAADAVRLCDISLNSELETVKALDAAAARAGRVHGVMAMVDLGDLREGVMPGDLLSLVEASDALPNIRVEGVGVNLTCYGAVMPTRENLGELVQLTEQAQRLLGRPLLVSGGNSSSLDLALGGEMPPAVNTLRIGESILLGLDTLTREPLIDLHVDAFTIWAPVIECKVKPSLPRGVVAQDAFGNRPTFEDRGERRRAICALGRQDAPPELLAPLDSRVEILGASSDHLILDVEDLDPAPRAGDELGFRPGYGAALQAFTSPYVEKVFIPHA